MTSDRPHTGTGQRPFWLIGSILLGFVLLVLAAAFLLDRQFRTPVGTQTAVAPAAGASAGATSQGQSQAAAVQVPWQRIARTPLEREVEEAYARYWQVLGAAFLSLDASRLPEVMDGDELARAQDQIKDLQARGRLGKVALEFHPSFREVTPERAVVFDEHINRSVFLDAATKQEIPTSGAPELARVSYELRKVNGTWKVVDGVIYD